MARALRIGGVPEHFNLPWRQAVARGAFESAGLGVDYREVAAGTGEMTRALRAGELDAALVLTEGAVADVLNHDACRLVKIWVGSPLTWGIHVAAGSALRRLGDIRGARYAISRFGSGSHLIAIVDAATRGWATDAMEFVVVDDLAGAREALAGGRADVFLWEKFMTQPLVDAGEFRRVGERAVPWPAFAVSASRTVIASRGDELKRVLTIAERSARNLSRRLHAAAEIAAEYGLQQAEASAWLRTVRWCSGWRRPAGALRRVRSALHAQGVVPAAAAARAAVWHAL